MDGIVTYLIVVAVVLALAVAGVYVFKAVSRRQHTPDRPGGAPGRSQQGTAGTGNVTDAPGGRPAGPEAESTDPDDR